MKLRVHLARVARALGTLNERVVFVGGATVDMFVTDRAAGSARFTEDVDVSGTTNVYVHPAMNL